MNMKKVFEKISNPEIMSAVDTSCEFSIPYYAFHNKSSMKIIFDNFIQEANEKENRVVEIFHAALFFDFVHQHTGKYIASREYVPLKNFVTDFQESNIFHEVFSEILDRSYNFIENLFDKMSALDEKISILKKQGENMEDYENDFNILDKRVSGLSMLEILSSQFDFLAEKIQEKVIRKYFKAEYKKAKENFRRLDVALSALEKRLARYFEDKENAILQEQRRLNRREKRQYELLKRQEVLQQFSALRSQPDQQINDEKRKIHEKISKYATRVENLLQKDFLTPLQKEEIQNMSNDLNETNINDHGIIGLIEEVREKITRLYEIPVGGGNSGNNEKTEIITSDNKKEGNEEVEILPKNQEMIDIIEKMLPFFTHAISSTKDTTTSYGDGSFAAKIFQPFLKSLISEIFAKNRISFENGVSWNDIFSVYEEKIEDNDRARTHFVGMLKKFDTKHSSSEGLFVDLYQIISDFSQTTFYHNNTGTELKTTLKIYEQFLQDTFKKSP